MERSRFAALMEMEVGTPLYGVALLHQQVGLANRWARYQDGRAMLARPHPVVLANPLA